MMRWFTRGFGRDNVSNAVSRRGALRCASGSLLGLVALIALNLAGCGGGGGGSSSGVGPGRVGLTILANSSAGLNLSGAVTLKGQGVNRTLTILAGQESAGVTFDDVLPGRYTVSLDGGRATTIFVSPGADQTIQFINGNPNPGVISTIPVKGRLLFNTSSTPQPISSGSCGAGAQPATLPALLRVRNLDAPGQPIVFFQIKPAQTPAPGATPTAAEIAARGTFEIRNLPLSVDRQGNAIATAFRIEVTRSPTVPQTDEFKIFGSSAAFTLSPRGTVISLPDICTSRNLQAPPTPPGPTPSGSPLNTAMPIPTGTVTATPTSTGFDPGVP